MSESEPLKPPVVCIGWPTIVRIAKGEEVVVEGVTLIAADGLYGCVVAPSPVVAEVVKEMREDAAKGELIGPGKVDYWASRLERGE